MQPHSTFGSLDNRLRSIEKKRTYVIIYLYVCVKDVIIELVFVVVLQRGYNPCQGRGANMIYIVEVLERMLILAASRLSMIALEKETGAWMETEEVDTEREERKTNTEQVTRCLSITTWNYKPFCYGALQAEQEKDFNALNSAKDGKFGFLLPFAQYYGLLPAQLCFPLPCVSKGGDLHIWHLHFGFFLS